MKKQFLVLSLSCLFALAASAQVEHRPRHAVHVAYLGEMLSHPGLSIGYEKFLNDESRFQIFMRANVGFYHHFRNNNTYMLTIETGYRINFNTGLFLEQGLGLGYFHRQINSDGKYVVNENGSIVEKSSMGTSFLPFLANLGVGYHFKTRKAQISPFLRPNFYWKMPLNETPNMQMSLMAGILYGF